MFQPSWPPSSAKAAEKTAVPLSHHYTLHFKCAKQLNSVQKLFLNAMPWLFCCLHMLRLWCIFCLHWTLFFWPPLWPIAQSSWLQIQRSRVWFPAYHVFWEVVGLELGPLSLVSTTEELLGRNCSGSGLESQEYSTGDPLSWPHDTLYPQKLTLTLPTSYSRLVSIVRSWPQSLFVWFFFCTMRSYVLYIWWWPIGPEHVVLK
jgi:hypothetical protein